MVVYVIILVYQLTVIKNIFNIFLAFYYNYIQRDKLVNLNSALSSGYLFFAGIVDYSEFDFMNLEGFNIYFDGSSQQYNDAYHLFYQHYVKYRFALGKDLSPIYINYNFTKIRVTWEEYTIEKNYIQEVEVMIYLIKLGALDNTLDEIVKDVKMFFNSYFKDNPGKLNTIYGQMLHYLSKNMQKNFITFFNFIQEEINESQKNYSSKSKTLSILIEILGFTLTLITLSSCIYFLKKTNINLYKSIINLFIDFTQEGNYSFKN